MEPNKVNDIDPNWALVSMAHDSITGGAMRVGTNFARELRLMESYYLAVYADSGLVTTLKSIRDFQNSNNNYRMAGKIILFPEKESFTISLIHGKLLDMVDLVKDPFSEVKRSKLELVDKNPSPHKISAEYDLENKIIRFKYSNYSFGSFDSDEFMLDNLIERLENRLKNGNSKLQD